MKLVALPDVNVLVALAWSSHPHHDAAHDWLANVGEEGWATCPFTQSGFLRLSMNPQVVGVSLDGQAAVTLLQGVVSHPKHQYIESVPILIGAPFDELLPNLSGYRQVADATLLHVARAHNLKLITFDKPLATLCPWSENLEILKP